MKFAEYFVIGFKKPQLSETEKLDETKKKFLIGSLELCYSKLEAVEILNSNSKWEESAIIIRHLFFDLLNFGLELDGKAKISKLEDIVITIKKISESEIQESFSGDWGSQLNPVEVNSDWAENMENIASGILFKLEKFLNKKVLPSLQTPMDVYGKRLKVQGVFLAATFFIVATSVVYNWIKYPSLKKDFIQVYYQPDKAKPPTESESMKHDLDLTGSWKTYTFQLIQPSNIANLKVDPVNQRKMKFQIQGIKYFDKTGKIIKERDFIVQDNSLVKDVSQFGYAHLMRPGKMQPGTALEMVTEGNDPYFNLDMGLLKDIAKIEMTMRIIENFKKFSN